MTRLDEIEALLGMSWRSAEAGLHELLDQAEAGVAERVWCPDSAEWENPQPLWSERDGRDPVRKVRRSEPDDPSGWVRYGLDGDGNVLTSLRVDENGEIWDATFWREAPSGGRVQLRYARQGTRSAPSIVSVPFLERDRLVRLRILSLFGEVLETYSYDATGLVTQIVEQRLPDDGPQTRDVFHVERDAAGQVLLIRVDAAGEQMVVYRRRYPGEVKQVRKRVEAALAERIPAWAARVAPAEEVSALGIMYSVDDPSLPPALGLVTRRERRAAIGQAAFAVADFECFDSDPDELRDLADDFQTLDREWRSRDEGTEPRKLLVAVAKRLNELDWNALVRATDDFVVYAVDDELSDLRRNLESSGVAP